MALVLAKSSLSVRDTSGDHPVVPPPPPPDRKSRRRIDLNRYCRQFLHFSRCRYQTKCKYIHIAFCRWYVTGGCSKTDCPLLHVDVCENWRQGEKCKFLPSCKYLHAGPRGHHRDPTLPAFSSGGLGRPVFHGPGSSAQPLVAPFPLAIADADDEDGVETPLR